MNERSSKQERDTNIMKNRKIGFLAIILAMLVTVAGCSREARKTKFFQSAKSLEAQGKVADAILQYRNVLQIDPQAVEARLGLGRLLLRRGDVLGGQAELIKVMQAAPNNLEAHHLSAQIYLMVRQPSFAEKEARAELEIHPGDEDATIDLGSALLLSGKADEAETLLRELVQRDPKSSQAWIVISNCRLVQKDVAGAETAVRTAVDITKRSPNTLFVLAQFLQRQNRTAEAQSVLEEAQRSDPKNVPVLLALSALYIRNSNKPAAEKTLAEIRDLSPANSRERLLLANYYLSSDRAEAVQELKDLIRKDGTGSSATMMLGDVLLDTNQQKELESLIRSIKADNKNSSTSEYLEGRLLLLQGNAAAATGKLSDAAQHMPKAANVAYYQGLAYLMERKRELARSAFNKALEINPAYGPARVQRGNLELENKEGKAALEDAQIAVRTWPVAGSWLLCIRALASNGRSALAQELLTKIISQVEQKPVRAIFRAQAALIDLQKKDFNAARGQLQEARSDDQTNVAFDQLLAASYILQNQIGDAEQVITRARTDFPDSKELALLQAQLYADQRKYSQADEVLRSLLAKNPGYAPAALQHAIVTAAQANWGSAAEQFEAIGREQKTTAAWMRAGQCWEHLERLDRARQAYEEAVKIDRDNVVALNNLSYMMLRDGGNVDVALEYAQHAQELAPNSPEVSDTLAWAYYAKNRYEFALRLLDTVIQQRPNIGLYRYHAGKCYVGLRDWNKARESFTVALRCPGNFPREDAIHELQNLKTRAQ